MSETPTVAEQAAPPPPDGSPSDEGRPDRQPLAFMLTHQSGVVIVVALIIALAVGALLIRLQGVAPLFAYETLIKQALFVPGGLTLYIFVNNLLSIAQQQYISKRQVAAPAPAK